MAVWEKNRLRYRGVEKGPGKKCTQDRNGRVVRDSRYEDSFEYTRANNWLGE